MGGRAVSSEACKSRHDGGTRGGKRERAKEHGMERSRGQTAELLFAKGARRTAGKTPQSGESCY